MRIMFLFFVLIGALVSCTESTKSENPLAEYFYPFDEEPMVYVYRDQSKGLDERFHRIYRIDDSFGKHLVVEIYSSENRLVEAYNYNIDSLNLMDHMVVDGNRQNQKGELGKTQFFPMSKKGKGAFMSRFPGPGDSVTVQLEVDRKVLPKLKKMQKVMGEKEETLVFQDDFSVTFFSSNNTAEKQIKGQTISYYSKGYGLTRWHDKKKDLDYQLEKIMTEPEWVKLVANQN